MAVLGLLSITSIVPAQDAKRDTVQRDTVLSVSKRQVQQMRINLAKLDSIMKARFDTIRRK
jgi:hypothetical protein